MKKLQIGKVALKKSLLILIALVFCCVTVTLTSCKAERNGSNSSNSGASNSINTSAADFPIKEAIVGTWVKSKSVEGYTFNADGTGKDHSIGSFTYTLEYRESDPDSSFSIYGWVLHISYDKLPAAKIMWVVLSSDNKTLTTRDTSGNTETYMRK